MLLIKKALNGLIVLFLFSLVFYFASQFVLSQAGYEQLQNPTLNPRLTVTPVKFHPWWGSNVQKTVDEFVLSTYKDSCSSNILDKVGRPEFKNITNEGLVDITSFKGYISENINKDHRAYIRRIPYDASICKDCPFLRIIVENLENQTVEEITWAKYPPKSFVNILTWIGDDTLVITMHHDEHFGIVVGIDVNKKEFSYFSFVGPCWN